MNAPRFRTSTSSRRRMTVTMNGNGGQSYHHEKSSRHQVHESLSTLDQDIVTGLGDRVSSTWWDRNGLDALTFWLAMGCAMYSFVYTTYLMWSTYIQNPSEFAFHPPLQMGSLAILTLSILLLQPANTTRARSVGLLRHQTIVILAALPVLLGGTWAIYHSKVTRSRPHFTSFHGKLGIAAVSWLCVQILVGGSTVWFKGAFWGGESKSKKMWKFHRLSGYLLYVVLVYTSVLGGAWSTFTNVHASKAARVLAYSIAPSTMVLAVLARIRWSKMLF